MKYIDAFVLPVAKKNLKAYLRIARQAGRIWRECGALEYRECVGGEPKVKMGVPFPKLSKAKRGETVLFSWILYKSRAHQKSVMAKVMKDPRMAKMMSGPMPFDVKRMAYGGFMVNIDA